jgi:hypothetical protein
MKISAIFRPAGLVLTAALLAACASDPKPVGEWREPAFTGKVSNVLVIGVTSRSTRRRVFEDLFVQALASHDVLAIPSYELITSTQELSRETVLAAIEGRDIDGILVTRMVGVREEEVYKAPPDYDHYRDFQGYYDFALQQNNHSYYAQFRVLTLETNLYETISRTLVWSMKSEVVDSSQPRHLIEAQIKLTLDHLKKQGLI